MDADSFHRLEKTLVDSEDASTLAEANKLFSQYGVRIVLNADVMQDHGLQIIALTAINTAARSFQGNVQVVSKQNFALRAPGFENLTVEQYLSWLGVENIDNETASLWPTIEIGGNRRKIERESIRPWANGWKFGLGDSERSSFLFAPACVAAGALAISESFSLLREDNPYAGKRSVSMSLWLPGDDGVRQGPSTIPDLPGCWLVGMGHLGQAYAWTLGFMATSKSATFYLQDFDKITQSTLSTSMLSVPSDVGTMKTRTAARWLENRGIETVIVERRFTNSQKVVAAEPTIALFGVDNPAARRALEGAGFRLIVDAGLGSSYEDFRAIRLRTFPGPSRAAKIWADTVSTISRPTAAAYRTLIAEGAEPCGVTTLATRAVGAPFVGCIAAAFVIAELTRHVLGGPRHGYVDLNLRDPQHVDAA